MTRRDRYNRRDDASLSQKVEEGTMKKKTGKKKRLTKSAGPKNYFTARISTDVERRFREAIPRGFGFGESVEAALRTWTDMSEEVRMETLIRRTSHAFDSIVEQIVARCISDGVRSGRLLSGSPPETPAGTDRDSQDDDAGPAR
jgi:uncharacterized protein (DUF4415 family)